VSSRRNFLLVGRWHAVTRDQQATLRRALDAAKLDRLLFVITAADQSGTRRHPLTAAQRADVVRELADALGLPFEIHSVADIPDSKHWPRHVLDAIRPETEAALDPEHAAVVAANPDVLRRFEALGFPTLPLAFEGDLPADVFEALAAGRDWKKVATPGAARVFRKHRLEPRLRELFSDVLLTDDGELSTGRDFRVYAAGMDASVRIKLEDIVPHVVPGRIADKGCGTGLLLVHLSELFPTSQIVGMDLSRELLRLAESQHYPNQNVSIVRGDIAKQHFRAGTLGTAIFSSVMHELYSYNGYDREVVRRALRNTFAELQPGGHIIIRDGVAPTPRRVWMRCDAETEERFRRFARDFKGKSSQPGLRFTERVVRGRHWFGLTLHGANEFLSKKDYLENWAIEVNEEFGVFTLAGWRRELRAAGFRVTESRSYLNSWILKNRYRGRAWLHADDGGRPAEAIPFPDTTAVIIGEVG
jgi:SAM-dependent methyltransferase